MNRRSASDAFLPAGWIPAVLILGILGKAPLQASPRNESCPLSTAVSSVLTGLSHEKSQSLVRIRCRDQAGEFHGTGFLIDPAGTVCTMADFVRDGTGIEIESGGRTFPATLLYTDDRTGVAFLKTGIVSPSFIPPFPSAPLPENSPVAVLAPDNDSRSQPVLGVTESRIDHNGERFFPVPLLAAQLPAAGCKPGTPVFDLSGKFAGIVVPSAGIGDPCAILPATAVEKLHGDLLRFGRPNPGWIGAVVEEAAVPEGTSRTRIAAVEPGSPAEKAGIRPGDSLLAIGSRSIVMPQEVLESSFYLTAGQEIRLVLSRSGELRRVTLRCAPVPGEAILSQQ